MRTTLPLLLALAILGSNHAAAQALRASNGNDLSPAPKSPLPDPPASEHVTIRHALSGREWLPVGRVWVEVKIKEDGRKVWVFQQRDIDSCNFCQKPMTFKQAAFDKKALAVWVPLVAVTVAHIEYNANLPCRRLHTCDEINPIYGRNPSRARYYGISMPILAFQWMGSAYLRKGDVRLHIGGYRLWPLAPILTYAAHAWSFLEDRYANQVATRR